MSRSWTLRSRLVARLLALSVLILLLPSDGAGGTVGPAPAARQADFNGDGYADLAIGTSRASVDGLPDAGAIQVLFGSAAGLQAFDPPDELMTQNTPGMPGGAEAGNEFGSGLAVGDFNGDGFTDLAVGAGSQDLGEAKGAGTVTVVYGAPVGLQTEQPPAKLFMEGTDGLPDAPESQDFFGDHLTCGDFNGDGFADLVVGVKGEDLGAIADSGEAIAVYGSPGGLNQGPLAAQAWVEGSSGVPGTPEPGDNLGNDVASGDVNGDVFDDLVVSASGEGSGGVDRGAVIVLHGGLEGLQAKNPPAAMWGLDSPGVKGISADGDRFGKAVAVGDFNADGYADLVVGIPDRAVGATSEAGQVSVLYGSAAGVQAADPDDQLWSQDSPGVRDRAEKDDRFGRALTAGDFNGDGWPDLTVDAPMECFGPVCGGAVSVLYGAPGGLQATDPANQLWSQDSPGVKGEAEGGGGGTRSDQLGYNVFSADFNGDGRDELAASLPGDNVRGISDVGAVAVLYGSPGGLQATDPDDQLWWEGSAGLDGDPQPGDEFGTRLPG